MLPGPCALVFHTHPLRGDAEEMQAPSVSSMFYVEVLEDVGMKRVFILSAWRGEGEFFSASKNLLCGS